MKCGFLGTNLSPAMSFNFKTARRASYFNWSWAKSYLAGASIEFYTVSLTTASIKGCTGKFIDNAFAAI